MILRGCLKSLHGFLQRYPHAMVIVDFRELRTIVTSSEAALHQLKTLMSGLFKQPLRPRSGDIPMLQPFERVQWYVETLLWQFRCRSLDSGPEYSTLNSQCSLQSPRRMADGQYSTSASRCASPWWPCTRLSLQHRLPGNRMICGKERHCKRRVGTSPRVTASGSRLAGTTRSGGRGAAAVDKGLGEAQHLALAD